MQECNARNAHPLLQEPGGVESRGRLECREKRARRKATGNYERERVLLFRVKNAIAFPANVNGRDSSLTARVLRETRRDESG